jgi:hypothetical protein
MAPVGELDGIGQQVDQHLCEAQLIAHAAQRQARTDVAAQFQPFDSGLRRDRCQGLVGDH